MRKIIVLLALLPGVALAAESASYKLDEHVFNAGGHPRDGTVLSSPSYQLTLSALGEPLVISSLDMDGGFVVSYPPPGEVLNVHFTDPNTLVWNAEMSVGHYNLYQGSVLSPFDPGYGTCQPPAISGEAAAVTMTPSAGGILFFLLTAENRLHEEGTKGYMSGASERPNPVPCP